MFNHSAILPFGIKTECEGKFLGVIDYIHFATTAAVATNATTSISLCDINF
jgi:hypothetical protein